MNRRTIFQTVFVLLIVFSAQIATADDYKLSKRSLDKLQEFKGLVQDAIERQKIVNAILAISPFQVLLDKPDPTSLYQIYQTDWDLLAKASEGFATNTRQQLKQYCELEAISQNTSPSDFKFWINMGKQFSAPRPIPSIAGTYTGTLRDKNNRATGLVEVNFSGSGKSYTGTIIYYNLSHSNPDGSIISGIKIEDNGRISFSADDVSVSGTISRDGKTISEIRLLNPTNAAITLSRK